jgi:outer membrane protein assembly factor BamB
MALALLLPGASEPAPVPATAAAPARLIASPEPGWPQWRGPRRDGVSDETGLLARWPEGGPPRVWQTGGLGRGYSAPIITGGRIFLTGDVGDDLVVFALDLDGRPLWQAKNGRAWKTPYPGARAAVTFSAGHLYHLNAHGRVACLVAATGQEVWAVEVFETFGGRNITWALSESLLVDGPRVMVTVGGSEALMAALDKRTGAVVWRTPPLKFGPSTDPNHERLPEPPGDFDQASYVAPILFELGGRRLIAGCSTRHFFGVDADSGELVWTRALPTRYAVIAATPVLVDNAVFVTAPDTEAGGLFRLGTEGGRVTIERAWSTKLDTCHGGLVRVGDLLIGSRYRPARGWLALDARSGEVRHELPDLTMGSVLYAGERLYCLTQDGEMALLELSPAGFQFAGRFQFVTERKHDVWTHPVILDGRLYLRHHENLSCYDIRAR